MNGFDLADPAFANHRVGLLDNRVEAPVVSHHHRHIGRLGVLYQRLAFGQIFRKRLFDQNGNAGIDTEPCLRRMERCRRCQDDAIRPGRFNQLLNRFEMRHIIGCRLVSAFCTRVGNSAQRYATHLADGLGVTKPHQAQAGDGNAQRHCCLVLFVWRRPQSCPHMVVN